MSGASLRRTALVRALAVTAAFGGLAACDQLYADPVTAPYSSGFATTTDAGLTLQRTPPVACANYDVDENGPCPPTGGVCEFGDSPDPECNTTFVCTADTSYGSYWTRQSTPHCADECPAPAAIVDGAPCTVGDPREEAELHCTMPTGTCICTTGRDGAHAHERRWVCVRPASDCPDRRPLLGESCVGEHACDYGSCASKRGARMICTDDVWQMEATECAD